jgi:hypothetical protein
VRNVVNSSKRTRRITTVLVGAAVAIGVLALSGTGTGTTATTHEHQGKKPTIVLEHGAFADAFS